MMVYVTIPTDIFAVLFAAIMVIHSSTKLAIEITVITWVINNTTVYAGIDHHKKF
jgi:hypothetical protein